MSRLRTFSIFALWLTAFPLWASEAPPPSTLSKDWKLTVYYTAVESLHSDSDRVKVKGCPVSGCEDKVTLGRFPEEFVKRVRSEGTGRITRGKNSGLYLCWSSGSGFWIDSVPKSAQGTALIPWVSAAADPKVMNYDQSFRVLDCGRDDSDGSPISASVCEALKNAHWKIMDRFEPGLGGKKHLDLYIGEEDQASFTSHSPKVISVESATIAID